MRLSLTLCWSCAWKTSSSNVSSVFICHSWSRDCWQTLEECVVRCFLSMPPTPIRACFSLQYSWWWVKMERKSLCVILPSVAVASRLNNTKRRMVQWGTVPHTHRDTHTLYWVGGMNDGVYMSRTTKKIRKESERFLQNADKNKC